MIEYGGWKLPDHEQHLQGWMAKKGQEVSGRTAYQYNKIKVSLDNCKKFTTAIDIGGHVGFWSYYLAEKFDKVFAYEPVADHRACFRKNITAQNVRLMAYGLGLTEAKVGIHTSHGSSGDSYVNGDGDIAIKRLDEVLNSDIDVGFIKADCEGYEYYALAGAVETIKRCQPVIMVEQKPGRAQKFGLPEKGAVELLEKIGYKCIKEISGDFLMVPK